MGEKSEWGRRFNDRERDQRSRNGATVVWCPIASRFQAGTGLAESALRFTTGLSVLNGLRRA